MTSQQRNLQSIYDRYNAGAPLTRPDEFGPPPLALFAAMLGAVGIAVVVILIITNGLDRLARLERAAQAAEAAAKSRVPLGGCDEPRKTGDRAVIIVRRDGAKLAIECNPLLDWREPMRSLKK